MTDIIIKLISYGVGLAVFIVFISIIYDSYRDYKKRHHNKKMRLCRKCKHNKERVVKLYHYKRYTREKYCNLKECIYDTKEVLKDEK